VPGRVGSCKGCSHTTYSYQPPPVKLHRLVAGRPRLAELLGDVDPFALRVSRSQLLGREAGGAAEFRATDIDVIPLVIEDCEIPELLKDVSYIDFGLTRARSDETARRAPRTAPQMGRADVRPVCRGRRSRLSRRGMSAAR